MVLVFHSDLIPSDCSDQSNLSFKQFMETSLYGPNGFYSNLGGAGRRADFLTSPEVGPLFGLVIANFLDSVWDDLGQPSNFDFVDLGAGPGTLARSILSSGARCLPSLNYTAIEVSARQSSLHPEGINSEPTLVDRLIEGVVFANEFLDNLPFRMLVNENGWRESFVAKTPSGYKEILREVDQTPKFLPRNAPQGARVPIQDTAREYIKRVVGLITRGRLVVIDYCRQSTEETIDLKWQDWLRTYSRQEYGGHFLEKVGQQDITCDVMLDQIFDGIDARFMSQASFLESHGIAAAVEEGRTYWEAHASQPDVRAMMMRSRVSEAEALTDPSGLGAFTVAEVVVGS